MRVRVTTNRGDELGLVRINPIHRIDDGPYWDYVAEFAIERGSAVGMHRVTFEFAPDGLNPIALLKAAMDQLTDEHLRMEEYEQADSPDLARRQRPFGGEVQEWTDRLPSDRSAIWCGQPEQYGGHRIWKRLRKKDR